MNEQLWRQSPQIAPAARSSVNWEAYRGVPNVDTLIKGAAGQVLAVGAEGHAVYGFLVLGQRVDANPSLDVPQSNRRVERGAVGVEEAEYESSTNDP